ncbi:MAG: 23S rRNA (guanosine(2251)-2'-O)-methyltransferase RlmB, partial [Actinomycetota bacterium]|nr:23S rRNA (guanosine(2251)-2'-O)-methyltransferase RlmB [Actinomycetota bacterium]
ARRRGGAGAVEWVVGRNPVVEALAAGVPVTTVYVAEGTERDTRLREALRLANERGLAMLEAPRTELDRLTGGSAHQGLALQVPPYDYTSPDELLEDAQGSGSAPLLVALDGVTDPRNLGAIVRSAAAFGAHGVVVPERRAAGMTTSAWKTSAGAAARVPVARAVNLSRQLKAYADAGLLVAGLAADGDVPLADFDHADEGLVLVVGSEGKGLSRLVREHCDVLVGIPMADDTESLNAGVAAGVALYEIARRRSG